MSKKSRRRNKKILGALALLGTGLALANRGKGSEMSNISVGGGKDASTMTTKVTGTNYPGENEFKETVVKNLGRMEGSGPNKGEIGQAIRANYAQKQRAIAADKKRNDMLRAIRSTQDIMTAPSTGTIFQNSGVPNMYQSARKGGRIVKGKKTAVRTGAAKRGFGRAFKGGRK